ncbi:hypothetical protein QJS10_CPA06g01788 [Acorus calamus]|uniref:Diacylglycerol glucosyltransferase N-terminal domain-containing protein n=1 Tax=Acorus calamus TaxID=4465 RepID=A0AAV9EHV3_ACOCL|nr:hypothetical protein QJS10_CPA06g01788 [Acorus calamus]
MKNELGVLTQEPRFLREEETLLVSPWLEPRLSLMFFTICHVHGDSRRSECNMEFSGSIDYNNASFREILNQTVIGNMNNSPGMSRADSFVREVAKGLMKYQPDIIISVHPLMQHVPLRILRAKGLLKKIVFTTVITDLSTCHPTWFHKLVTRCYFPSAEVAKRASKAGLKPSQIKVYGLPVRPSFVKSIRPKISM